MWGAGNEAVRLGGRGVKAARGVRGRNGRGGGVGLEGKKGDFGGEIKDILGEKGILGGGE